MSDRQEKLIRLIQQSAAGEIGWDEAETAFANLFYRPEYLLPKGVDLDLGPLRVKTFDDNPCRCEHVEIGGARLGWCKELIITLRANQPPRFTIEGQIKMYPIFRAEETSDDGHDPQKETVV